MRLWVLVLAGGLAWLSLAHAEPLSLEGRFCVQSFQLYSPLYSRQKTARFELLSAELLATPCEATQLQNLWNPKDFTRFASELKVSGSTVISADAGRVDRKKSGLAAIFNGNVIQSHSELFSLSNEDAPRDWLPRLLDRHKGFTSYEVQFDQAPATLLLNLQVHPTDSALRLAQLAQVADHVLFRLPRGTDMPLVLTAALPAGPGSPEVALLENVLLLHDAYPAANGAYGNACTLCAANPLRGGALNSVADYTFFRSSADFELRAERAETSLRGTPAFPLSDHYGLRSVFHWSLRAPSFLLEDDPEFVKRRQLALETLVRTKGLLQKDGRKVLEPAVSLLEKIRSRLEYGTPDTIRRMYRLR